MRHCRFRWLFAGACCAGVTGSSLHGQSFNVDWDNTGSGAGVPSSSFAAVGAAGVWNSFLTTTASMALTDLSGAATTRVITRSEATMSGFNHANTSGDHQSLLDDYQILSASPLTITISNLAAGRYKVITYGIRTASATARVDVSVSGSLTPNPQTAGGSVPVNSFTQGITHTVHDVDRPISGTMTITVSTTPGSTTGAINGLQLVYSQPTRIYVDGARPAGGDGLSWATAFNDLQTAMNSASTLPTVTEVWVARGTYKPAGAGGSRSATFLPNKKMYGGFAGTETLLSQRNVAANPTILSGDLNGDDTPGFGNRADNVYHVLSASLGQSGSRIDGFTVRGGHANGAAAADQRGGGLNLVDPILLNVDNCTFTDNYALDDGAALYWLPTSGSPSKTLIVSRCLIQGNHAVDGGAALRMNGTAGITTHLVSCRILNNTNGFDGTVHVFNGVCHLVNCLIAGNRASNAPGVEFRSSVNGSSVRNCTITQNYCPPATGAGVLLNAVTGTVTVANTIARYPLIEGNPSQPSDLAVLSTGTFAITRSAVTGATGSGVLTIEPRFRSPLGADLVPATGDEDFSLLSCSGLTDQGENNMLPADIADLDGDGNTTEPLPLDLDGAARQVDLLGATNYNGQALAVDIGAFEGQVDFLRWNQASGASDIWEKTSAWTPNGVPGANRMAFFPFVGTNLSTTTNAGTDDADQLVIGNWHYFFTASGTPSTIRLSPTRGAGGGGAERRRFAGVVPRGPDRRAGRGCSRG